MSALPGKAQSCWIDGAPATRFASYERSDRTDVAVIGGGIVGLTAAYLLARAGVAVTVLEARRIARGVTSRSTAKVTTQHTLAYSRLAHRFGLDLARSYAQANQAGMDTILHLVGEIGIDCDLERRNAYAYTLRASRRDALVREARVARELGLPADVVRRAPLPFANEGALVFTNQAQFNPARYLVGLAKAVTQAGGRIFEDTRVTGVKRKPSFRVESGRHHLSASRVVVATHLPIATPIPFDNLTQPRCHIAMAFRAKAGVLDGMFIDVDRPAHSLRMGHDEAGPLLVVLGPKFATGQERDVARRFRDLEAWVRANVPAGEAAWRWVNEDYDSPDHRPFAGELGKKAPGMYVATGFNGWGISNGTAAAMLIADRILGRSSPWTALYDPERRARKINQGGETRSLVASIDAIAPGDGAVIEHGKQSIAVWKSADGRAHALSAKCTHMGCTVTWNNADRTWDCPCHGSMFTREGDVIHGPATEKLKAVRLPRG